MATNPDGEFRGRMQRVESLIAQAEQLDPAARDVAREVVQALLELHGAGIAGMLDPVHAVVLQCQVRIEPQKRRYTPDAQARLGDLFGEPHRWGQTLRGILWTHASVVAPPFTGRCVVDLPVPCSFDFNVAATKYFAALDDGEVPLKLLFSGTVFHEAEDGALQVAPISRTNEADFRLPVRVWREMMDQYYPNSAWLCLHRDVFDRLYRYKVGRGLPTWEQALGQLLDGGEP